MNYLDIEYDERSHPKTAYPDQLALHLCRRYNIKKGVSFLEIGCGRGDFANAFARFGLSCHAVDILDRHPDLDSSVAFDKVDLEHSSFPIPDNSIDVIFTKSVIEHIADPSNLLRECKRVLKPGGKAIVMTPEWKSMIYLFYEDYTHIRPYTDISLRNLLLSHGFDNVHSEVFYQLPILWRHPRLKIFSRFIQLFGPPKKIYKNKFFRWSRELMALAYGEKL